jgi:hypothetical protein
MGLFGGLGKLLTLPVKIATLPVRVIEKVMDPYSQPLSDAVKEAIDVVEKSAEELDE